MNDLMFQDIMDILADILPQKWARAVYRADYTEGSYSMKYYVDLGDGEYTDCFKLGTPTKSQVLSAFRAMNEKIITYRQSLSDKEKWSVLTMTVDSSGKFKADFDFTNISEIPVSYQTDWENRYLH